MRRLIFPSLLVAAFVLSAGIAVGSHIPKHGCTGCADHKEWPKINGKVKRADKHGRNLQGSSKNDELMGWHTSDTLRGAKGSDVLWGDFDPTGQPATQKDVIYGGDGSDFIYGSHGHNIVYGGSGNDAISVHYGYGMVDCGPGRDIYHVARSRRKGYTFRNCEKVDYRPEQVRGGGLKPLP